MTVIGTKYRHLKTGITYIKLFEGVPNCTNRAAESLEKVVIYQNEKGMIFVREENEFEEKFKEIK
jgi:hypothetical protein